MNNPKLKTRVPIGTELDNWIFQHYSEDDIERNRSVHLSIDVSGFDRDIDKGLTCLIDKRSNHIVMTDCQMELDDFKGFYESASGDIVIAGLGGGFILEPLIEKESIKSITVIESDSDLCDLLSPLYPEVQIVNMSAFDFSPPDNQIFDYAWLDIWYTSGKSEYNSMCSLKEKFQGIAKSVHVWAFERPKKD